MLLRDELIKRLSVSRHIYNIGVQQIRGPYPAAAILCFHDALEMFLLLGIEHRGAERKGVREFLKLFDALKSVVPTLEGRSLLQRINEARNPVKHAGLSITLEDIEGCHRRAQSFFEQTSQAIFEVDFFGFSIVSAIVNEAVREQLEGAEVALTIGAIKEAVEQAAIAFRIAELRYESLRGKHVLGHSLLNLPKEIGGPVSKLGLIIENIELRLNLLSVGVSSEDYRRFVETTPIVHTMAMSNNHTTEFLCQPEPTEETAKRAISFVIDVALRCEQAERAAG